MTNLAYLASFDPQRPYGCAGFGQKSVSVKEHCSAPSPRWSGISQILGIAWQTRHCLANTRCPPGPSACSPLSSLALAASRQRHMTPNAPPGGWVANRAMPRARIAAVQLPQERDCGCCTPGCPSSAHIQQLTPGSCAVPAVLQLSPSGCCWMLHVVAGRLSKVCSSSGQISATWWTAGPP